MKDYADKFEGRHMIVTHITNGDGVIEAQGFYCSNGPEVDGEWNVRMSDGTVGPGPRSESSPMYFFPEAGVSTSKFYDNRAEALREVRNRLEREQDRIVIALRNINNELIGVL